MTVNENIRSNKLEKTRQQCNATRQLDHIIINKKESTEKLRSTQEYSSKTYTLHFHKSYSKFKKNRKSMKIDNS